MGLLTSRAGDGRSWPATAAAVILGVVAVVGCSNTEPEYLDALLADPMADFVPAGAAFIDKSVQSENPRPLIGKPKHAQVVRRFRFLADFEPDAVVAETRAYAEQDGWLVSDVDHGPEFFYASKTFDVDSARLVVNVVRAAGREGAPLVLRITLDFGHVLHSRGSED